MTLDAERPAAPLQLAFDASAVELSADAPETEHPGLALARTIRATATETATVYRLARASGEVGGGHATTVRRFDLDAAPSGLLVVTYADDEGATRRCSVHQGRSARIALAELVKVDATSPTSGPADPSPLRLESAQAFLDRFRAGDELRSPLAEALVVLVASHGQPWWYLVRLVDDATLWGIAPAGQPIELHPGRFATFWSRLATVVRSVEER